MWHAVILTAFWHSQLVTPPLVVIVAYGAADLLRACLAGVEPLADRVVVVDNSASDEVASACADVRYVRAPHNLGFGGGVNLALETAWDGTADVLLLNPDAVLAAADIALLQAALHSSDRVGMVSPLLAGSSGETQRASWPLPGPLQIWLDAGGLGSRAARRHFLAGTVLLLKGETVADVGLFDERYFLYVEETDWQRRALRRGWQVVVADTVTAEHVGGATGTSENTRRCSRRSRELYLRKWFGPAGWTMGRAGAVVAAVRRWRQGSDIRAELHLLLRRIPQTGTGRPGQPG